MALVTYKWSIEEWHELLDTGLLEGKSVEFLEGEIVEVSPQRACTHVGIEHSYTNCSVVRYLMDLLAQKAEVIQAQPITLDNSEPEPDVTIARLPETIDRSHHPYPQDIYWLIEVSNRTLEKELEQKIVTYARNGIPEYWVINLVDKKLIVHTQVQKNSYAQVVEYKAGTVSPLAFPEIAIALDKLLLF